MSGAEIAHRWLRITHEPLIITQRFVLDFLDLQAMRLLGDNNRIIANDFIF